MARVYLAPSADQDLRRVMAWTVDKFGVPASIRYRVLIKQALKDIGKDPTRPGSKVIVDGLRTYHLSFSRSRMPPPPVKNPRHYLLYRFDSKVLEVARILYDSYDLVQHLPEEE